MSIFHACSQSIYSMFPPFKLQGFKVVIWLFCWNKITCFLNKNSSARVATKALPPVSSNVASTAEAAVSIATLGTKLAMVASDLEESLPQRQGY